MNTTFSVGAVLSTGFRVWLRNLVPFLLITAVFYAPPWIWAWQAMQVEPTLENFKAVQSSIVIASFLTMPINVFVGATLTYGVVMDLHGQRATIAACMTTGLNRFFPALAVTVMSILCVGLASVTVIGGIIVFCMLYVATPVAVLERAGILGALGRSSALTRGHRWGILGLLVILIVLSLGTSYLLHATMLDFASKSVATAFANLKIRIYLDYVHEAVLGSLGAVMASVSYYLLRAEKEGTTASELAAIFD